MYVLHQNCALFKHHPPQNILHCADQAVYHLFSAIHGAGSQEKRTNLLSIFCIAVTIELLKYVCSVFSRMLNLKPKSKTQCSVF